MMIRKKRNFSKFLFGVVIGLFLGHVIFRGQIFSNVAKKPKFDQNKKNLSHLPITDKSYIPPKNKRQKFVYVGIMTAEKYLRSRAVVLYNTWGKEIKKLDGEIGFFSSTVSHVPNESPELPLIPLPWVDDSYPPQKKSFIMLQYMWQHYGDKFEWFIRADDDVYIRTRKLKKFLASLDPRKPLYIGQAGKGNAAESGLLSLEFDENFCMGGPGIILSRETLRRVVKFIELCMGELFTQHEDVEVGRCVKKYAGVSCTWSYEMQSIFHHNNSNEKSFIERSSDVEVQAAMTLHPVKSSQYMYQIHNHIKALDIRLLQHARQHLNQDIRLMYDTVNISPEDPTRKQFMKSFFDFNGGRSSIHGQYNVLGSGLNLSTIDYQANGEVVAWNFVSQSMFSHMNLNPKSKIDRNTKEGLGQKVSEVIVSINGCSQKKGRFVEEKNMIYGYTRVIPQGSDSVLDLLLIYRKYRGKKLTLPVRRHIYLHQQFMEPELRETSFLLDTVIVFILPLHRRHETFRRFLRNYEQVCILKNQRTALLIVLFTSSTEEDQLNLKLVEEYQTAHPSSRIRVLLRNETFSRAKALDHAASKLSDNDLMFFVDVDIAFTSDALDRIRRNTQFQSKIYFPIVFSTYHPMSTQEQTGSPETRRNFVINESHGFWRIFGFGIVSVYKKDYVEVGGFEVSIKGWGKEDVNFFEKSLLSDSLKLIRSTDPGLVHIYHNISCRDLDTSAQMTMCNGTLTDSYASTQYLARLFYEKKEYMDYVLSKKNLKS